MEKWGRVATTWDFPKKPEFYARIPASKINAKIRPNFLTSQSSLLKMGDLVRRISHQEATDWTWSADSFANIATIVIADFEEDY